MRIPDEQLALFEQRLQVLGLGRRDFLKAVGAMAAFGGLGFATRAEAAKPFKLAPGEKLAKEQVLRLGGGGFWQNDPSSHDYNKDLYCAGVPIQFAGLMNFNADFVAEPYLATKVQSNKDGSVWTFTIRKDSRWSDNSPVSARDFEWSWKRQLDPESKAPYAAFLYDIKNGEAFNKKQVTNRDEVGVKAKDVHVEKMIIPIIPVQAGSLPYENNELDLTWLQPGDLKKLQSDPRMQKDVFQYPYPGTWYLLPQATKPPFDNLKVRRAVAHAVDRENVVKVSQGLAIPAWSMIPPGFPGAVDDPKIKAIQRYDKKAALEQLKGTPFEGGKNWPKITLSMREEGLGSKPLAEAVQAVLLDSLNMKTDLEVLEQRVFRERLWKQDLQFVWIRWFMDYPDPHNEYFDTFYGKKTTGKRQAWVNDAFDKELEGGRDTRDPKKRLEHYKKAEEIMQMDVGYVPVAWVARFAAAKPWVKGIEKNKQGQNVIDGNIYVDMMRHIYIIEKG